MPKINEHFSPDGLSSYQSPIRMTGKNDGNIDIKISSDNMTATATLFPPYADGKALEIDTALELCNALGIKNGLNLDDLQEKIFELNTERRIIRDVIIAKGAKPVSGYTEHNIIYENFLPKFVPVEEEKNIDWKSTGQIKIVKKGQIIGEYVPARPGINGMDILGKEIPFTVEKHEGYKLLKNIELNNNKIISSCDGQIKINAQNVSVEEILIIKGDIDYKTGHIMFPGDVFIEGGVAAGFKILSGGSLTIKETMDASEVQAKKDITCLQGIIGKEPGHVRSGGTLKAKFIENASIAVRNNAEITNSIVGTKLFTLGQLVMSDKGRIIGGEIFATHGVNCGFIGGQTKPITIINVGMDFTVQQKIDQNSAMIKEYSIKLAQLKNMIQNNPGRTSIEKVYSELNLKIQELAKSLADLSMRVDIDTNATVSVKNLVYPGVIINICHSQYVVSKELKKPIFKLDIRANKIIVS